MDDPEEFNDLVINTFIKIGIIGATVIIIYAMLIYFEVI
jgi:hypothetical protein